MLDRRLVEDISFQLNADPALVEKDWHVVRALGVLATLDRNDIRPAFSGGTSLSIGWGLIKRFSEDVDFKVALADAPSSTAARNQRRDFREAVLAAMTAAEFRLAGAPLIRNGSRFFSADFFYPSQFDTRRGLRPHLRMEMSFEPPKLDPIAHPIRSLVSRAQGRAPEIAAFACVDPVETAADKLSALAWRVCCRERGSEHDDPSIIRHLHDLAALEQHANAAPQFLTLLKETALDDSGRGGGNAPRDPAERFAKMLDLLANDAQWAREYDEFVQNVSFAAAEELIPFAAALQAVRRLLDRVRTMH